LVDFWEAALANPERLAEHVARLKLEDYLPSRWAKSQEYLRTERHPQEDIFVSSALFYAINRSSFSGATLSGGFSKQAYEKRFTASSVERLKNFKAPTLSVECADFEDSLTRHDPSVFVYADPPYLLENSTLYGVRGSTHKDFNHHRLYEVIKKRDNWVMSYNPHPEILELYKDYEIVYPEWAYGMSSDKKSKEILILNVKENEDALSIDD
jgi:DNA adenine methylase